MWIIDLLCIMWFLCECYGWCEMCDDWIDWYTCDNGDWLHLKYEWMSYVLYENMYVDLCLCQMHDYVKYGDFYRCTYVLHCLWLYIFIMIWILTLLLEWCFIRLCSGIEDSDASCED